MPRGRRVVPLLLIAACAPARLIRHDHTVASDPGVTLAVREVRGAGGGEPVVLVHGAGPAGVASFDLDVPGGSLAADLARAGHPAYALDVRGWGRSSRTATGDVGSDEAARDVAAVVAWVRARHGGARVALFGWATGGHWAALAASRAPDAVAHLVMLNAVTPTAGAWPMGERLGELGATVERNAANLVRAWEASIPVEDKGRWRDPRVARAMVDATLGGAPSIQVPAGPLRDSRELTRGARPWDPAALRVPTLYVRGELDFWSRPEDAAAMAAAGARVVTLPGATHHLFLDRPERGRDALLREVLTFLSGGKPEP